MHGYVSQTIIDYLKSTSIPPLSECRFLPLDWLWFTANCCRCIMWWWQLSLYTWLVHICHVLSREWFTDVLLCLTFSWSRKRPGRTRCHMTVAPIIFRNCCTNSIGFDPWQDIDSSPHHVEIWKVESHQESGVSQAAHHPNFNSVGEDDKFNLNIAKWKTNMTH